MGWLALPGDLRAPQRRLAIAGRVVVSSFVYGHGDVKLRVCILPFSCLYRHMLIFDS